MVNLSVLLKLNVSFSRIFRYINVCNSLKRRYITRNISVLFNLILAKHKNNPNFNGHRNVDKLVQNTVRRYMLDLTGFLSEAGKLVRKNGPAELCNLCVTQVNEILRTVGILLVCGAPFGSFSNTCR